MKKINNQNNFNGRINFNGPVQFSDKGIMNNNDNCNLRKPSYRSEPKWRSPFTLAILTWVSTIIGLSGLIPLKQIFESPLSIFKGNRQVISISHMQVDMIIFIIWAVLFILFIDLRRIAKKQIRIPLISNYAISGLGKRITIEKIHIDKCPQCGGRMKYYQKTVKCSDESYNGEKIPVLECMRNNKHYYEVDPTEDI